VMELLFSAVVEKRREAPPRVHLTSIRTPQTLETDSAKNGLTYQAAIPGAPLPDP